MIQFFATRAHQHLICEFLDSWSPTDRAQILPVAYEKYPVLKPLPHGVCIFIDFERLLPKEFLLATKLADALRKSSENYSVLNEPGRYPGRFQLQKKLRQNGSNDFNVHRAGELDGPIQFPVFVRNELDHNGPITPLLHSRSELDGALEKISRQKNFPRRRLMIVEYCDCQKPDGFFRKYSVMNVGGTLIPRHVLFSTNWATKTPDSVNEKSIAEEIEFTENFPHAEQIQDIFHLANLDYGRIDYGVKNGRIQVWEINTNPTIVPQREKIDPRRLPTQSRAAQKIIEALRELSQRHPAGSARPFKTANFLTHRALQMLKNLRKTGRA